MNKDYEKGITLPCPICGAKPGTPCGAWVHTWRYLPEERRLDPTGDGARMESEMEQETSLKLKIDKLEQLVTRIVREEPHSPLHVTKPNPGCIVCDAKLILQSSSTKAKVRTDWRIQI